MVLLWNLDLLSQKSLIERNVYSCFLLLLKFVFCLYYTLFLLSRQTYRQHKVFNQIL